MTSDDKAVSEKSWTLLEDEQDAKSTLDSEAKATISAKLIGDPSVEVSSGMLGFDQTSAGDITSVLAQQLSQFPLLNQAYQFGRISANKEGSDDQFAIVTIRARLVNDGQEAWPESTTLRVAAGNPFGLQEMHVGSVAPELVAELELNLVVPLNLEHSRSVWALEIQGQPFGPLMILEVA